MHDYHSNVSLTTKMSHTEDVGFNLFPHIRGCFYMVVMRMRVSKRVLVSDFNC